MTALIATPKMVFELSDLFDASFSTLPGMGFDEKALAETLIYPLEENITTYASPMIISDNQGEAEYMLLDMISNGISTQHILNLTQSSPFDIIAPTNGSTTPYIVISFATDTPESCSAVEHNARPVQNELALVVPEPGMMYVQDEAEEEMMDVAGSYWWGQVDGFVDSSHSPWSELSITGSTYGSEPDYGSSAWGGHTTGLLGVLPDACYSYYGTVEPWRTTLDLTVTRADAMEVEDWSEDYELMDDSDLEVEIGVDLDMDEGGGHSGAEDGCMSEGSDNGDDDDDMSDYDPEE